MTFYYIKRPDASIFLCANAINRRRIIAWLKKHASHYNVEIRDITDTFAQIAITRARGKGNSTKTYFHKSIRDKESLPLLK